MAGKSEKGARGKGKKGFWSFFFPIPYSLLPLLCLLSACGFHPVYGSHGGGDNSPAAAALNRISIDNIPDHSGQLLRNDLIDSMYGKGRPAQPAYTLTVKLRQTEEDIGILANATATRTMLNMYGDYVLKDMQGKEILKGTAHSVASFNQLSDQYATLVARNDAIERTINEVSQQIVNRLSLHFAEDADARTSKPDDEAH